MAKRKRKNQRKAVNKTETNDLESKVVENSEINPSDSGESQTSVTGETQEVQVVSSTTTEPKTVVKGKSGSVGSIRFLNETQTELSKVVWPSRQQLISESAAVILMVTLVATTIYFVDGFFTWVAGKVF